jgi:hypothetical protein
VFLNSLHRETPKNVQKKVKKNNILGLVGSSKVKQIYAGVRHFFFKVPLGNACNELFAAAVRMRSKGTRAEERQYWARCGAYQVKRLVFYKLLAGAI